MIIRCYKCKSNTGELTDLRGRGSYETRFIASLTPNDREQRRPEVPLYCCMDCLNEIHIREQSEPLTLSVPQLLRNASVSDDTSQTVAINSPDSSIQDLRNHSSEDISIPPSSESLTTSVIPSQPLVERHLRLEDSNDSVSSSDLPANYEIVPPSNPLLLARYQRIMSKPGPMSIKRKLVRELEENNAPDSASTLNSEEIAFLDRKLAARLDPLHQKSKKQRTERNVRSISSTPANSLEITPQNSLVPSGELIVNTRPVGTSPQANETRILTPIISTTPRMRMQTQSQREESPIPQRGQAPLSQGSSSSSSSQSDVWRPPARPPPHSNSAAPRRIQNPTGINLGASGRNPRQNAKNLGG